MTIFFACLMLAGVILFGLGAKGVVVARTGCAGGALASVLTLVLGISALLIGAATAIACLAIATPAWSFGARFGVLAVLAAISASAQIRRALPVGAGRSAISAGATEACVPTCSWSWYDDDDDGLAQFNPTTGLPMMPGSVFDVGGNCFMQSADD